MRPCLVLPCPFTEGEDRERSGEMVLFPPLLTRNPIQDVSPQGTGRNMRMVKIVGRVARHAQPLHHTARGLVGGRGERNDLLAPEPIECEVQRRARRLRGVPDAPSSGDPAATRPRSPA